MKELADNESCVDGRGTDQVVEAVLADAEHPLHYFEIAERVSKKLGRPADPGRGHNAAAAVGILLGRGTDGLEKHIQISSEEAEIIREEAEDMVLTGPAGRQWHASEILNALLERDFKVIVSTSIILIFCFESHDSFSALAVWPGSLRMTEP